MEPGHKQDIHSGGAVATAFPQASEAAVEMLRSGGNAVDAAVAAAWALSVCEPSNSGLGGQTTLLLYVVGGRTRVIDGYSHAPEAVSRRTVSRTEQQSGFRACTIPSTPATLEYARSRYGVLPRAKVMEPAIRLAQDGYAVTRLQRRQMKWCRKALLASPAAGRLFLRRGHAFCVGDIFRQAELAATLSRMADVGVEDFYRGQIARVIADDMAANGGLVTEKDLAEYDVPVEREPLTVEYRGHQVMSVLPPGGGLQVLLGLRMLEHFSPDELRGQIDRWYEILAEVTYAVFRHRQQSVLHPRDMTLSSLAHQLNDEQASTVAEWIRAGWHGDTTEPDTEEAGETTHLCTADRQGNIVALTQSIQSLFGAKVANDQLGFLYNNYLSTCKRRPHPYRLGSRCIPLSNIAPTLLMRKCQDRAGEPVGGTPLLAVGAAGSRRITSAVLQVISSFVDRGVSLEEAVRLPRIHGLLSRKVYVERPAATEMLLQRLEKRFRKVTIKAACSYSMGGAQAIGFRDDQTLVPVADPRRDGVAVTL